MLLLCLHFPVMHVRRPSVRRTPKKNQLHRMVAACTYHVYKHKNDTSNQTDSYDYPVKWETCYASHSQHNVVPCTGVGVRNFDRTPLKLFCAYYSLTSVQPQTHTAHNYDDVHHLRKAVVIGKVGKIYNRIDDEDNGRRR